MRQEVHWTSAWLVAAASYAHLPPRLPFPFLWQHSLHPQHALHCTISPAAYCDAAATADTPCCPSLPDNNTLKRQSLLATAVLRGCHSLDWGL